MGPCSGEAWRLRSAPRPRSRPREPEPGAIARRREQRRTARLLGLLLPLLSTCEQVEEVGCEREAGQPRQPLMARAHEGEGGKPQMNATALEKTRTGPSPAPKTSVPLQPPGTTGGEQQFEQNGKQT